ncbi:hypothetical protein KR215_003974, partial [Drosophila sulfurigaster]
FTNVKCVSKNLSWVLVHNCRLKAINKKRVDFNYNSTILHPVNNIEIHTQLFKKSNGYKPWLIDVTFDACSFLRKNNHPVVNMVYGIFRSNSNINHTCPYMGPIFVKDLYLKPSSIPLPVPTGDYYLLIEWKFDRRLQVTNQFYVEYIEDS